MYRAMCYLILGKKCSMETERTSPRILESTALVEKTSLLTSHGKCIKNILKNRKKLMKILL